MRFNFIHMINWKCFIDKRVDFNSKLNFLKWENGSGKSSLIEAIIFALYDKRPSGLDFNSLRNDLEKDCEITLSFTYKSSEYIINRTFGKSSTHELIKDGELIARTKAEKTEIINNILPENIITGLWGNESLASSPVLKTDYLYELLDSEFELPLKLKKYFTQERSYHQKRISTLEKTLNNQTVNEKDIQDIKDELKQLDEQLKNKVFVNNNEYINAVNAKNNYPIYQELKNKIDNIDKSNLYSKDIVYRLNRYNLQSQDEWNRFFKGAEIELEKEKLKVGKEDILATYPKNIIDSLYNEGQKAHKCILCNGKFNKLNVNYTKVDHTKIHKIETLLKDKDYDFNTLQLSNKFYQLEDHLKQYDYIDKIDWKGILEKYDKDSNDLFHKKDTLELELNKLEQDFGNLSNLLKEKEEYDEARDNIKITEQYVNEAKDYYSKSIVNIATDYINKINPRYSKIYIENGVYKIKVSGIDYIEESDLVVASLSMGEKTLVSLSLILAIRDLFAKDMPFIMDEAFSNLDNNNLGNLNHLFDKDKSQWIIVSHDERLGV